MEMRRMVTLPGDLLVGEWSRRSAPCGGSCSARASNCRGHQTLSPSHVHGTSWGRGSDSIRWRRRRSVQESLSKSSK
ncbi:hypothetical protein ARMGADRAFT_791432 [Armillaria gallica]|uniref:Uncharacterized protein n=1 Tax=Armillaria gallica TaxID=47427 RepID=A0A2H3DMD3_ARMGA|nr:hypothetical protein ARMGADRAFT_791432 [Armillaria gallica]